MCIRDRSRTSPVDPCGTFWGGYASTHYECPTQPAQELVELLQWACQNKVITDDDRALLLSLVEAADGAATRRLGRGTGGLMANKVSETVAQHGASRRRRCAAAPAAAWTPSPVPAPQPSGGSRHEP